MIQDGEEPDPETGEMSWAEEKDEGGDTGEDEKVYIGKVGHFHTVYRGERETIELTRCTPDRSPSCFAPSSASSMDSPSPTCWTSRSVPMTRCATRPSRTLPC